MKPIRIALLHYTCPPIIGGVEEILHEQALLFQRYYHPVKVFAGKGGRFIGTHAVEINPLLGSRHPRVLKVQENLSKCQREFKALVDTLFNYLDETLREFDILIAHNVLTMHYNLPLTYALHRLAETKKIKVVSWNHDSPFFYEKHPAYLDEAPWKVLHKYNPQIHYIAISESRKKQFLKLYSSPSRIKVIPNGIDPIRFFQLDPATVRVIQENNLFEAEFLMVQPSRLLTRKNIELSIQVLRALHDRGFQAWLLVTGSYDPHEVKAWRYYGKLKKLAEKLKIDQHVLIMAEYYYKSGEKQTLDVITMRDLYLIADILFLPSLQEGFGIPLLEAGMSKLPIFCSDIPPFREIGQNDVYFFSLRDAPVKIADQILEFATKSGPHKMYRKVIHNFVWDNIYRRQLLPYLSKI